MPPRLTHQQIKTRIQACYARLPAAPIPLRPQIVDEIEDLKRSMKYVESLPKKEPIECYCDKVPWAEECKVYDV